MGAGPWGSAPLPSFTGEEHMATTYRVIGRDDGEPSLPDSVLAGKQVGDTFTTTLDPALEAILIDAGLIEIVNTTTFTPGFALGFADGDAAVWDSATSLFTPGVSTTAGTFAYTAGTVAGTIDVPADALLQRVSVVAGTAGSTITIGGGTAISVPAGYVFDEDIAGSALGADVVIGLGTQSYYISWTT